MREGEGVSQEKKKGEKSVNSSEGKQGEEGDCSNGGELSEATRAAWSANQPPQLSLIKLDFSQLRSQPHVLPKSPGGHKRMC